MKILKKSKSLNTKMEQRWLDSAGVNHFWMIWRFKFLIFQLKKGVINLHSKMKKHLHLRLVLKNKFFIVLDVMNLEI